MWDWINIDPISANTKLFFFFPLNCYRFMKKIKAAENERPCGPSFQICLHLTLILLWFKAQWSQSKESHDLSRKWMWVCSQTNVYKNIPVW